MSQTKADEQLRNAAERGNLVKCRSLLRHGADVNATGRFGRTSLHEAAIHGHADLCRFLIEHGADVAKATDANGATPLHFAATAGSVEACRVLVDNGADIRALRGFKKGDLWHTPLQVAVIGDKVDVVRYFVEECGEDLDQITYNGKSLIELADTYNSKKLMAFLPVYRNSIKTGQAVSEAMRVEGTVSPPSRSRGPSPL